MVVAVVFWCLMVSVSDSGCLEIWGDLGRVIEEFLKGYLSAVYGHV